LTDLAWSTEAVGAVTPTAGRPRQGGDVAVLTKNRIGNALAVAAAVVGLVLVFSGAGHGENADGTPPPASQVQAPAPVHAPTPVSPPTKDDDG
jgi:hypothetical protein